LWVLPSKPTHWKALGDVKAADNPARWRDIGIIAPTLTAGK